MIYFIPFTFKIFILRKFLIIFLLFSCKEKPNLEDKLEQIKKTENFNIMEWTTRNVFEITFTKQFGIENRFAIETKSKVRFCVSLNDLKYRVEGNYVIFQNLPNVKVCSYHIVEEIQNYDEDIFLLSVNAGKNRRLAFQMAIESTKIMIKNLENDPNIQEYSKTALKEFLSGFVKLFGKEAKFEE